MVLPSLLLRLSRSVGGGGETDEGREPAPVSVGQGLLSSSSSEERACEGGGVRVRDRCGEAEGAAAAVLALGRGAAEGRDESEEGLDWRYVDLRSLVS